jgi:hypothetical protein
MKESIRQGENKNVVGFKMRYAHHRTGRVSIDADASPSSFHPDSAILHSFPINPATNYVLLMPGERRRRVT